MAVKPAVKRPVRHDPKPRHIDGTPPRMRLKNARPDMKYVAASKTDPEFGIGLYESRGYKVVHYEKGGVMFMAGQTARPGEPLESMGHVLMAIPRDRWEEIEQYGEDGGSGQALADEIEDAIVDRERGMADKMRGLHARAGYHFRVANRTGRPELDSGAPSEDPFA